MKLQISVNDEMVHKIDTLAKALGVSRSALCAIWIGQGLMGFNQAQELVKELGPKIVEQEAKKG
jgi:predicted transcriptional regulator